MQPTRQNIERAIQLVSDLKVYPRFKCDCFEILERFKDAVEEAYQLTGLELIRYHYNHPLIRFGHACKWYTIYTRNDFENLAIATKNYTLHYLEMMLRDTAITEDTPTVLPQETIDFITTRFETVV